MREQQPPREPQILWRDRSGEKVPSRSGQEAIRDAEANAEAWAKENPDAVALIDRAIEILQDYTTANQPYTTVEVDEKYVSEIRERGLDVAAKYLSEQEIDLYDIWREDPRLNDYLRTRKGAEGKMNDLKSAIESAHDLHTTNEDKARKVRYEAALDLAYKSDGEVDIAPEENKPIENKQEKKKPKEIGERINTFVSRVEKNQSPKEFFNTLKVVNSGNRFFNRSGDISQFIPNKPQDKKFDATSLGKIRKLLSKLNDQQLGEFIELYGAAYVENKKKAKEQKDMRVIEQKNTGTLKQENTGAVEQEKEGRQEEKQEEKNENEEKIIDLTERFMGVLATGAKHNFGHFLNIVATISPNNEFISDVDFARLEKNKIQKAGRPLIGEFTDLQLNVIRLFLGRLGREGKLENFIKQYGNMADLKRVKKNPDAKVEIKPVEEKVDVGSTVQKIEKNEADKNFTEVIIKRAPIMATENEIVIKRVPGANAGIQEKKNIEPIRTSPSEERPGLLQRINEVGEKVFDYLGLRVGETFKRTEKKELIKPVQNKVESGNIEESDRKIKNLVEAIAGNQSWSECLGIIEVVEFNKRGFFNYDEFRKLKEEEVEKGKKGKKDNKAKIQPVDENFTESRSQRLTEFLKELGRKGKLDEFIELYEANYHK